MRGTELAILYGLVGLGAAVALILVRSAGSRAGPVDLALVAVFWPLYGPFLFISARPRPAEPFAALLPDDAAMREIGVRLDAARRRVEEIERLLAEPDFSADTALARREELVVAGDERAAALLEGRLENIRRLALLRDRSVRELGEADELCAQIRVQSAVVRLGGAGTGGAEPLIAALASRVEGLAALLDGS